MIVEALGLLLPPELQFLITDRGTHVTANAFKTLLLSEAFSHVLIARHRPESNGIAERFVRTLKAWLADKAWLDDQALAVLLQQFLVEYGDRPIRDGPCPACHPMSSLSAFGSWDQLVMFNGLLTITFFKPFPGFK